MDSKDVNYDFAKAWDLSQGDFAKNIANRMLFSYNDFVKI